LRGWGFLPGTYLVPALSDGVSKWSVSVVVIDDCVYWSFDCADAFGNGYNNSPLYSPAYHVMDYI
jgi:hypothetical protein